MWNTQHGSRTSFSVGEEKLYPLKWVDGGLQTKLTKGMLIGAKKIVDADIFYVHKGLTEKNEKHKEVIRPSPVVVT